MRCKDNVLDISIQILKHSVRICCPGSGLFWSCSKLYFRGIRWLRTSVLGRKPSTQLFIARIILFLKKPFPFAGGNRNKGYALQLAFTRAGVSSDSANMYLFPRNGSSGGSSWEWILITRSRPLLIPSENLIDLNFSGNDCSSTFQI